MHCSISQRCLCFNICVGMTVLMLSGCILSSPDIANREWERIHVIYMVRVHDTLRPRSWSSWDQTTLSRLRVAFPTEGKYMLFPKPLLSKLNRLDVKLRGGQWWSLAYFPDSGNIGIIDPYNAMRTFLLENSKPEGFYIALTNEIMHVSGIVVDLDTKFRSDEEARALGLYDDAAWYEKFPK